MLFLTLILTPSFSSPILEGNAVGVRIQFPTEQQKQAYRAIKSHIKMHDSYKKCYTNTFQTVKTICRIHNPSAKKGDWAILMFVQSYFHPFFNFSPKSIRKCSFIQMRSFRETHLNIYPLPSSYPPIFKNSRGHHTKVHLKKNYVH